MTILNKQQAEWTGSISGVLGALIIALNVSFSPVGWWLFLISNISWIRYGMIVDSRPMILMQLVFMVIDFIGIYRWIVI